MNKVNPTEFIDISFEEYVNERAGEKSVHMEGGIPDYAYSVDYRIRQKINSIPGAFQFFRALTNQVVPLMKQQINIQALRVGPNQFEDIYNMTIDCAKTLGIGVPTVFIQTNLGEMNAWTYATDDEAPIIVINSALIERLTPNELKTVIGHECGHIHNNHGIYEVAVNTILSGVMAGLPIVREIMAMLSLPLRIMLMTWSRAAEVTCDRAGIICSENMTDIISADLKFLYGGTLNRNDIDIESVLKQYDMIASTPVRLLELDSSHPIIIRRIFADKEFMKSEILFKWKPEWKNPGMILIDKAELDARCEKYISVIKSEKRR